MGKTWGGNRTVANSSWEYVRRQQEVGRMRASGKYSAVKFSKEGGGYVAIEKSKDKHSRDEIEAAWHLAHKGYKVILKDESNPLHKIKSVDGYIFNVSFEQRTPTGNAASTIKNALIHARDKRAEISVIYTKKSAFTRQMIEQGIKDYEKKNYYRLKKIIVVSSSGKVQEYRHND